jgi:Activator of Hsp90 ATPase homolog 1-like protein
VQSLVTVTLEARGGDETMMTIEHDQLPPEQVDSHRRGWGTIAVQLGDAIGGRGA